MNLAQLFPYSVWECWWLAPVALILDLWLGDPDLPWRHPVCAVGKLLEKLESPARNFMRAGGPEGERVRGRFAGAVALAVLVGLTGLAVWGLVSLPVLGGLLALYLAWAGLAMGSLLRPGARCCGGWKIMKKRKRGRRSRGWSAVIPQAWTVPSCVKRWQTRFLKILRMPS